MVHRMITMHARFRRTDGRTDGQTDEHHGNSATIRSNERIARQNNQRQRIQNGVILPCYGAL